MACRMSVGEHSGALGQMMPMSPQFLILVLVVALVLVLIFAPGLRRYDGRRLCRDCGANNPVFARFCRRCGKRL